MELRKSIWSFTVFLTLIVIQTVKLSPLNSIQDSSKDELAPCSYDCTTKEGFCQNGGVCVKVKTTCSSSSFICDCPNGYEGKQCDQIVATCEYDSLLSENCGCNNGATCRKVDSLCARESYKCECSSGFTGIYCDVRIVDEVLSQQNLTLTLATPETSVDFEDRQNVSDVFNANSSSPQPDTTLSTSIPSTSTRGNAPVTLPPDRGNITTTSAAQTSTKNYIFRLFTALKAAFDQQRNHCPGCLGRSCENGKCICDSGYVGKNCDKKETLHGNVPLIAAINTTGAQSAVSPVVIPNNVAEIVGERDCYINFKCKHGVCNKTDPEHPICICDEGYIGHFCDTRCSKHCYNGGICTIQDGAEQCACAPKFGGEFCNETVLIDNIPISNNSNPKTPGDTICSDKLRCVHGECDKSNPTKYQCRCDEGFVGIACDIPCSKLCQNGGECRVSNEGETCHCPANFWGELCEEVVNASIALSGAGIEEGGLGDNYCAKNFKCDHGVCNKTAAPQFRCVCDDGYTGVFCHIKCTKICKNGGECTRIAGDREVCLCPRAFTGEFCEEKKVPELKVVTTYDRKREKKFPAHENGLATKRSVTDCTKICPKDHHCVLSAGKEKCERKTASITFKTLSRLLLPSKSQRSSRNDPKKCSMNFICVHGVCDNSDPWRPRCVCDDGFVGAFCHQGCTLQCSNGGRCVVLSNEQYCNCQYGYSGRFCDTTVYFDKAKVEKETAKNDTSDATTTNPSTTEKPA